MTTAGGIIKGGARAIVVAFAALLQLAPVSLAADTADTLRCHALEMMCEIRYQDGAARCERVFQNRATLDPAGADKRLTNCEDANDTRRSSCLDRVHARQMCNPEPGVPSPHECAAEQFQLAADFMLCEFRCSRRDATTVADCNTECTTRCMTHLAEIRSDPICAKGPIVVISDLDEHL